jgi:hypothetical protein
LEQIPSSQIGMILGASRHQLGTVVAADIPGSAPTTTSALFCYKPPSVVQKERTFSPCCCIQNPACSSRNPRYCLNFIETLYNNDTCPFPWLPRHSTAKLEYLLSGHTMPLGNACLCGLSCLVYSIPFSTQRECRLHCYTTFTSLTSDSSLCKPVSITGCVDGGLHTPVFGFVTHKSCGIPVVRSRLLASYWHLQPLPTWQDRHGAEERRVGPHS